MKNILTPLVTRHYNKHYLYQCGSCFFNSGELARLIGKRLGKIIDVEKLRILVVRHRMLLSISDGDGPEDRSHIVIGMKTRAGEPVRWKYHSVLEYDGMILDLDLGGRGDVLPFSEWLSAMFPQIVKSAAPEDGGARYNTPGDLAIHAVPAREYLARFDSRPEDQKEIDLDFTLDFPRLDIRELLARAK